MASTEHHTPPTQRQRLVRFRIALSVSTLATLVLPAVGLPWATTAIAAGHRGSVAAAYLLAGTVWFGLFWWTANANAKLKPPRVEPWEQTQRAAVLSLEQWRAHRPVQASMSAWSWDVVA